MKHKNPKWYENFKREMLELIEKYEKEQKISVQKITLVALGPGNRDIDMIINKAPSRQEAQIKDMDPLVLDACCGSRAFWFDKMDERAMFVDIRQETIIREDTVRKDGTPWRGWTMEIKPDKVADFTDLPFPSDSFALVVFDPPHANFGHTSYMAKQYGTLGGVDWRDMLSRGFAECFRVLRPEGVLVFKWNEQDIMVKEILKLAPEKPLFGHKSGKLNKTHWICFIKSKAASR